MNSKYNTDNLTKIWSHFRNSSLLNCHSPKLATQLFVNLKYNREFLLKFQLDSLQCISLWAFKWLMSFKRKRQPSCLCLHTKAHPHLICVVHPFLHPSARPLMPHSSLRTLGSAPSSRPSTDVTLSSAVKLAWLRANAVAGKGDSALFFRLVSTHLDGLIWIMDTVQHTASKARNNLIVEHMTISHPSHVCHIQSLFMSCFGWLYSLLVVSSG